MKSKGYRHLFGPVPSRRLGRSLGVDLAPFKTCSYDCLYCQLGPTTRQTVERAEYVPVAEVLRELERRFEEGVRADYVTLGGSGEPTLHSGCGEIIRGIKEITDTPVAVLTNGSLLGDDLVRKDLARADLVVPSLDAGSADMFARINRPHPHVVFEDMVCGLRDFCAVFAGEIRLEVFLLQGLNALESEVKRIAACAAEIRPSRVQLNTVARPPAYGSAVAVPEKVMEDLVVFFGERGEVVADFTGVHEAREFGGTREEILALLQRRPCTLADIADSFGLHRHEVLKHVAQLIDRGEIGTDTVAGKDYYVALGPEREEMVENGGRDV